MTIKTGKIGNHDLDKHVVDKHRNAIELVLVQHFIHSEFYSGSLEYLSTGVGLLDRQSSDW